MKKRSTRLITLLLALLMIIPVLASCSNDGGTASPTSTPSASPTPTPSPTGEDSGDKDTISSGLPLVDEPATITVWQSFTSTVITSINESEFVKSLEAATGVRLEFTNVSSADAVTLYNLMITSGDYCDIVREGLGYSYQGGGDRAIEDGVYLRLNDLIDEHAPNYSALRAKGGDYEKMTITDKGNIWSIYGIKDPAEAAWCGMGLRKDILDRYDMALPVTLNDWEQCLQAFKDDGVRWPLLLDQTGVFYNSEFLSAYGVGREFYQIGGKAMYGFVQPGFKDYLEMMNSWYEKGLVDQDFAGRGIAMVVAGGTAEAAAMLNRGEAAATLTTWGYSANRRYQTGQSEIESIWIAAVQAPKMNENDIIEFKYPSWVAANANAITTSCENPELAVRLLDYLFSEEGSIMMNYGQEGVSYTLENGKPRYTDVILKDPDGNIPRDVSVRYVWDDGIGLIDYKRLWQAFEADSQDALVAYEVWDSDGMANVLPQITLTQEEGAERSALMGDIQTYVNENVAQFITGAKPLSDFDSFVSQIYDMNIERALNITQIALDRYNAR